MQDLNKETRFKYRVYVTYYPGIDYDDCESFCTNDLQEVVSEFDRERKIQMATIYVMY